jgi:hypothetical protein
MTKLKFHPLLDQVPLMPLHERDALGADIEKNGQILPVLTFQGKIIDGRNRYLACIARRIEPKVRELTKYRAKEFVASMNYFRKHWSTKERAHFAALMSLDSERGKPSEDEVNRPNDRFNQTEAAEQMSVSVRSVGRAKAEIQGKKPEPKDSTDDYHEDFHGLVIPPEALPYWKRRGEIEEIMRHVSAARVAIGKIEETDPLYRRAWPLGNMREHLNGVYNVFRGILPSYVCGYCNGVNVDKCKGCSGTGLLSVYLEKALPPEKKHRK